LTGAAGRDAVAGRCHGEASTLRTIHWQFQVPTHILFCPALWVAKENHFGTLLCNTDHTHHLSGQWRASHKATSQQLTHTDVIITTVHWTVSTYTLRHHINSASKWKITCYQTAPKTQKWCCQAGTSRTI
jgi:hypothetical protein